MCAGIGKFNKKSIFKSWFLEKNGTNEKLDLGVMFFIVMITGKPTNLRTNRRQGIANRKSSR